MRASKTRVGIRVGSFGVPYAKVHEFGFAGPVAVRAHQRLVVQAFGRRVEHPARHPVRGHERRVNIRKRPYLRPAVRTHRDFITETIAKLFGRA